MRIKNHAFVLLLMLVLGVVLTLLWYSREQGLNQAAFVSKVESMARLENLDRQLLVMMSGARFDVDFEEAPLRQLHVSFAEELDNLRFALIRAEISDSEALESSLASLDALLRQREQQLDEFVISNRLLIPGLASMLSLTEEITLADMGSSQASVARALAQANAAVFALPFAASEDTIDEEAINFRLQRQLAQLTREVPVGRMALLREYGAAVEKVLQNADATLQHARMLQQLGIGSALEQLEAAFISYQRRAIDAEARFRIALAVYTLIFLLALLWFGWRVWAIRKVTQEQNAEMIAQAKEATNQAHAAREELAQSQKMAGIGEAVSTLVDELRLPLRESHEKLQAADQEFDRLALLLADLDAVYQAAADKQAEREAVSLKLRELLQNYRRIEPTLATPETRARLQELTTQLSGLRTRLETLGTAARVKSTDSVDDKSEG